MRLGILKADTVRPELIDQHGDYGEMFERLLEPVGLTDLVIYPVTEGSPTSVDCDAYLITGSAASVYDEAPWIAELAAFVERVYQADRRVIGICFGHQLLAHFFGGRCEKAAVGWGVGLKQARILEQRPWMQPAVENLGLLCSHQDQVVALPDGATCFAGSDFCPIAGFEIPGRAMTLQGHPEFSPGYSAGLMGCRREQLGEAVYQVGMDSLANAPDANLAARWIANFLDQ